MLRLTMHNQKMTRHSVFVALALVLGAFMTLVTTLPGKARAIEIQEVTSPGGIKAWLVEDYSVPIITMNVAFRGGASQEASEKAGLANLMSGVLDEGAGDLDSKEFQERLDDLNINLNFDAGRDAFFGNLRTLLENRDEAFGLFRLALNEPRFDEEPIERIRNRVLSNLNRAQTNPNEIASRQWSNTMFGDHPYGRSVEGTLDTVPTLSADDLASLHKRLIAKDNLYVAVVGSIDAQTLGEKLDLVFGDLPDNADLIEIENIVPASGERRDVTLSIPQTMIRLGGPGLKRDDPDFIPAFVANHILGAGTFTSKLFQEVRESRGLAYSVGSGLVAFDHSGGWHASASTRADAADETIEIMTGVISDFGETGPSEEELQQAKDYLTGNYALRFDASQKIARQLIGLQLDDLGTSYVDERNDLIRAVTIDDVKRASKRVFGDPANVVTVGPAQS